MTTRLQNDRAVTRRRFLAGSAGLSFGIAIAGNTVTLFDALAEGTVFQPNAWIEIGTDNTVTLIAPAAEMGQGAFTSLPMLIAEELDADWSKVRIEQAPADKQYGNPLFGGAQVTGGSRGARGYFTPLRLVGAQARQVLLTNVAEQWKVPVSELSTEPNLIVHKASGRSISYGDVAKFAKVPAKLPEVAEADLKPRSQWRLIGKDLPRLDVPSKVNGTAQYGIDIYLPDMLYAAVLRAPVQGEAPDNVDDSGAVKVKGVLKVVPLPFGVAVVAPDYWTAKKGKDELKVTWKKGSKAESYTSGKVLDDYAAIAKDWSHKGVVALQEGDVDKAFKGAAHVITADYRAEHVYHAPMEPMNTTAWVKGDGMVEVWTPTQAPTFVQLAASKVAGTTPDKVLVHSKFLGGGFGRRIEQDITVDATLLSKLMGKPVKVLWSREDDVRNDKYRPATAQHIEAALDQHGKIVGWRWRLVGESIFRRNLPQALEAAKGIDASVIDGHKTIYTIPNQYHDWIEDERGVDVGFWRAVGPGYTTFAIETFMDELAHAAKKDPLAFRLEHIKDARAEKILKTIADMAHWGRRSEGRALGLAYHSYPDVWWTHVAQIAEVSVDKETGRIKVHKIWAAVDPGPTISPANVAYQIEGGAIFGTSAALHERITIVNGEVKQSNFHDYPILRIDEAPAMEVKLLPDANARVGGVGEAGLPPAAPAIANAVRALTGARLRELPLLPERVKAAMKA
ncbi:MAG TPA: molybdopterin cofactor-binding domain-containing protein [Stellaceae bacterium]|nr:molybdopterin cofactor-binding domain-containing protein [Stellaceae bacterium]